MPVLLRPLNTYYWTHAMNQTNKDSAAQAAAHGANTDSPDEESNSPAQEEEAPEIQQLRDDLKQSQDLLLLTMADFDNYRKRVERERATAARAGKRDLILKLLDIVDAFDRALEHMEGAPRAVRTGVEAIHRQFLNLLQSQGVTPFDTVGKMFDPTIHEAIGAEDSDLKPGTVIGQVRRGYRWGDEILRPAEVRIAK